MLTKSARGAITAENTKESILSQAETLLAAIMEKNGVKNEDVSSVIFSCTKDLNAVYPAVAARKLGLTEAALFCVSEMDVIGSLPLCVRVLLNFDTDKRQSEVAHVYLDGAKKLRPDLVKLQIAIDGPGGSGKSTAAKEVAKRLGLTYVDTGAMYRAVAFFAAQKSVDAKDEIAVNALLPQISIEMEQGKIFLNGEEITDKIRTAEIGAAASIVASYAAVREKLTKEQKHIAEKGNVIMDGRDIAANIMPFASVKIYMDASPETRANRRVSELTERFGNSPDFDEILAEIKERDERDATRAISPLVKAKDAVVLDTSDLTEEQVVAEIIKIAGRV
ncbi:hypothetical protein FACS189490_08540 [Clostridia bacterium]|nr:hypothetical protein FACS189490_08540 [Clostridia bacterium]